MTKQLCAMVGLMPLPATIKYNGESLEAIKQRAVLDAKEMYQGGIRCIMVQNIGDIPMVQKVGLDVVAEMAVICAAIRDALPSDCKLGISVLMNDGAAALAIAHAVGADFIRTKIYVGAMVGAAGIEHSCMDEVLQMKLKLGSRVGIWADVHDRTGVPLGDVKLLDACEHALIKGLADVLIITGKSFEQSMSMISEVKQSYPKVPVYLGGGAKPDNLSESLSRCDGVIVGSYLKKDGIIDNPLDENRMNIFLKAWEEANV